MQKRVVAVRPFNLHDSNFKIPIYEEWVKAGGQGIESRPLEKYYRGLSFHIDLPTLWQNKSEARLRFVEGASLQFDTFPDYITYEVIPMFWDCWPKFWEATEKFLRKHKVRTAFFTSSQTADHFREIFPQMNIFHIPEAIETDLYPLCKPLSERTIDYLEFGRCCNVIDSSCLEENIKVVSSKRDFKSTIFSRADLIKTMGNSKITIALTRNDNQPNIAQGIDTLTQRYWECMLSGILMLGRAPKELMDIIGYNPTIPLDKKNINRQIIEIKEHINDFQTIADKNRSVALEYGGWDERLVVIKEKLHSCGYII